MSLAKLVSIPQNGLNKVYSVLQSTMSLAKPRLTPKIGKEGCYRVLVLMASLAVNAPAL